MEKFLTIKEVCEMMRVTRQTVYCWIREGKIKTIKYGKFVRIPASQFEEREENKNEQ